MFMSVDLPAPFSPRRAWISPGRTPRSMWSLASTPGYRFVTPLISSAGTCSPWPWPSLIGLLSRFETKGGPTWTRPSACACLLGPLSPGVQPSLERALAISLARVELAGRHGGRRLVERRLQLRGQEIRMVVERRGADLRRFGCCVEEDGATLRGP